MINKNLALKVLGEMQYFSKCGLISPSERAKISEACKQYTQNGDDDMFYDFLDYCSVNMSRDVVKQKFKKLKEEIYNDDNSQDSGSQDGNRRD